MGVEVVSGAMMSCSFGVAPASLTVLPANRVTVGGVPAANIMDYVPMMNIPTFGMCMSPSNPQVAAATAAALGVLTPQPCIPVTSAPWSPGSPTVTIGNQQAQVLFSGLAPGFPALYQINIVVPSGLSAGNQPITVSIGGKTSPAKLPGASGATIVLPVQ